MTGLEPLVLKQALQLTAKGIHELGKPVTQDKLVVALKRYPTVPKLSWVSAVGSRPLSARSRPPMR
jgi:hypothetical protein